MTAKKYVENTTADRLVVFQRDIFKDFVNQICKEQRDNCAKEAQAYLDHNDIPLVSEGSILNAKQPEV